MMNERTNENMMNEKESKRFLLVEGEFGQCGWATLNYSGDNSLAYCAKYGKIMDGWTVMNYCKGYGGCDR